MPPSIGTNQTRGSRECAAGVDVRWERVAMHGAGGGIGVNGSIGTWHWLTLVICGTDPGMLFLVWHKFDQGVSRRVRLVVGLGAAMIVGASVTRMSGVGVDVLFLFTL